MKPLDLTRLRCWHDHDAKREGCLFYFQCFAAGLGACAVIGLVVVAHFWNS